MDSTDTTVHINLHVKDPTMIVGLVHGNDIAVVRVDGRDVCHTIHLPRDRAVRAEAIDALRAALDAVDPRKE